MNKARQKRLDSLYRKHVSALKRQGKAETTIDVYSRALRRICEFFDCPPDVLKQEQFEAYFESLVSTHSDIFWQCSIERSCLWRMES